MGLFAQVGGPAPRRSGGSASSSSPRSGWSPRCGRCRTAGARASTTGRTGSPRSSSTALIAVVGLVPEVGELVRPRAAIQVEAILLILLVLLAHGLVWRFMTMDPPAGRHEAMSPPEGPGLTAMTETPAQEFREIGGRFGDSCAGVRPDQWDDPSPVEEWTARDVVRHLVEWFPAFLVTVPGSTCRPVRPSDEDPVGAWQHLYDEVLALLEDPATAGRGAEQPAHRRGAAAAGGLAVLHRRRLPAHAGTSRGRAARTPRSTRSGAPRCWPGRSRTRTHASERAVRPTSRGPGGRGCPDQVHRVHRARSRLWRPTSR